MKELYNEMLQWVDKTLQNITLLNIMLFTMVFMWLFLTGQVNHSRIKKLGKEVIELKHR